VTIGKSDRPPAARPTFQRLSEVEATQIEWLWPGHIPLGKVTLILGDPGVGKSTLTTDLAARVSTGTAMPDGSVLQSGGVVLLSDEDGKSDTVRPRFDAAGGDPSRVLLIPHLTEEDGTERAISLPEDIPHLRTAIRMIGARLLVLDPLVVYLSGDVNSWRDQDVRRALTPLATLAEETGIAIVVVAHLNKRQNASVMYRAGGSIGIVAAARAAFIVAKHPDDESRRVLAQVKLNCAAEPTSWIFYITDASNGSSRVVWDGTSPLRADELLEPPKVTKQDEAIEFLREQLASGPQLVTTVEERAIVAGISLRTLSRARKILGVQTQRDGFQGQVLIHLPEDQNPERD
jgi:hypothetical protein